MLPENMRMKRWLEANGINAIPKWIETGSLKRSWRLWNYKINWSMELANKLTAIGFRDLHGNPLGEFSGNGGMFCVFVRGHEHFLTEVKENKPVSGVTYQLTGKPGERCISNGNTWAESAKKTVT